MLIIPAIDLRGGNCVRLTQGKLENETIYSKDPVFVAKMFQSKGAARIHIVDLDGAFVGTSQNLFVLEKIRAAVTTELEFGGGIRKEDTVDRLVELGINKIIIGTLAVFKPELVKALVEKHGDRIVIAIDVYEGKIAIGGWKEITQYDAFDFAIKMRDIGVKELIVTDIKKDGMMEGPNVEGIRAVAKSGLSVIASGGVSTLADVKKICAIEKHGVTGMIIGKALYTDSIKLEEAIEVCSQKE
jgi:phosphoribosylformimino-5-aminoimidazole carboxamide ribotide isomerase